MDLVDSELRSRVMSSCLDELPTWVLLERVDVPVISLRERDIVEYTPDDPERRPEPSPLLYPYERDWGSRLRL